MRRVVVGAVLALFFGMAGSAHAATIAGGVFSFEAPPFGAAGVPLVVTGAAGEANDIEILGTPGGFTIRELGGASLTEAAQSCSPSGPPKSFFCTTTLPGYSPTIRRR